MDTSPPTSNSSSSPPPAPRLDRFLPWTLRQRAALAILLILVIAWFLIRAFNQPSRIADPQPAPGPRAAELAPRIDPNTADWPALAALPVIGEKHAREIVAYRDQFQTDHPDQPAFARPEDLMRIKGIGKATTQALSPYLVFPPAPAEASP